MGIMATQCEACSNGDSGSLRECGGGILANQDIFGCKKAVSFKFPQEKEGSLER